MPSIAFASPLIAAGLDWLEGLLPVLFVLFWIVSQIWGVVRRAGGPPREPAPKPKPRAKPAEPPAVEHDVRGRLEQEIEAFLREADRPRAGESRPAPPPKHRDRPVRQPPVKSTVRRGERVTTPPPQPERAVTAAADVAAPPEAFGSDVARHVSEAFATDLRHQIGPAVVPATHSAQPAWLDLVTLLRNPESLRQLIVVREVLNRPVDRW